MKCLIPDDEIVQFHVVELVRQEGNAPLSQRL